MSELTEWLVDKSRRNHQLYEVYGRPLESTHRVEYAAIGFDGQVILGRRAGEVLQEAVSRFGSGSFALARIGYPTFGRWLSFRV